MAHGKNQRLRFKRRRNGQTDYRRRMKLLRGNVLRAVVRVSNTQVTCQLVEFGTGGDRIISSVTGQNLVDNYKWPSEASKKSIPATYLVGLALAKNGTLSEQRRHRTARIKGGSHVRAPNGEPTEAGFAREIGNPQAGRLGKATARNDGKDEDWSGGANGAPWLACQ